MKGKTRSGDRVSSTVGRKVHIGGGGKMGVLWEFEARDSTGALKWTTRFHNLVVDEALNDILSVYFKSGSATATWYMGLTAATPVPAAGDTMASHGGWTENQTYDEGVRQTIVLGSVSGKSVSNSASKAVFTISGSTTVGGAFATDSNTKGGATGKLYSCGAFTEGNRSLEDNDTLSVTVTFTSADDGA